MASSLQNGTFGRNIQVYTEIDYQLMKKTGEKKVHQLVNPITNPGAICKAFDCKNPNPGPIVQDGLLGFRVQVVGIWAKHILDQLKDKTITMKRFHEEIFTGWAHDMEIKDVAIYMRVVLCEDDKTVLVLLNKSNFAKRHGAEPCKKEHSTKFCKAVSYELKVKELGEILMTGYELAFIFTI